MTPEHIAALALLERLIDLDEKKPTVNPAARAIIEDARILTKRVRRDAPESSFED